MFFAFALGLTLAGGSLGADFVGSQRCESCHQTAFDAWKESHHHAAMQPATPDTVLGDFSGQRFRHFDERFRFEQSDGKFWVYSATDNSPEQRHEVTHTFGIYPLQQYLLKAPRGRKQALTVAWDSRSVVDGGQRWYHLYPDEATPPGDELHWLGPNANWNGMCAECHSTNLTAGYRPETDRFDTRFSEVSVGCEACHGPGSEHIAQARQNRFDKDRGLAVDLDDQGDARWLLNTEDGIARRSVPAQRRQQTESCGRCHARRSVLTETYRFSQPLTATHRPALLEDGLYHADGRILDEVYVYGSFKQSAMYAAGVTCTNCHNPHTGKLKTAGSPSGVCSQCHAPAVFASAEHAANAGVSPDRCVDCHMPARTYMGIDSRRDHSFRIPGAGDQPGHYGQAIAAGRAGHANDLLAAAAREETYPSIARATALSLLSTPLSAEHLDLVWKGLASSSPLTRIAALDVLAQLPPQQRGLSGMATLKDKSLAVRIAAARAFASFRSLLPQSARPAFDDAVAETRASLRAGLWQPLNAIRLAEFESALGDSNAAEKAYLHALKLSPKLALIHHAFGLFLVRQGRQQEALASLEKAVVLAPDNARMIYVLGVALNSLGQPQEALKLLRDAFERFPGERDIGWALTTILRDTGELAAARHYAQSLADRFPDDPNVRLLLRSLPPP
ncbi:MAG: tetratricopeptide repeat protein [Pseudomonadota bacterium]